MYQTQTVFVLLIRLSFSLKSCISTFTITQRFLSIWLSLFLLRGGLSFPALPWYSSLCRPPHHTLSYAPQYLPFTPTSLASSLTLTEPTCPFPQFPKTHITSSPVKTNETHRANSHGGLCSLAVTSARRSKFQALCCKWKPGTCWPVMMRWS